MKKGSNIGIADFDISNISNNAYLSIMRLYSEYKNYLEQEKIMCNLKEEVASKLKELLNGHNKVEFDRQGVNCKQIIVNRINIKRLREERPDICEEYSFKSSYTKLESENENI